MTTTDTNQPPPEASKIRKERSPSFPFIGLSKALERVRAVYAHAKRHEARLADLAAAWGMGVKSSGTIQTVAALVAYGLLEDQGSGETRKFKVTELALKALEDQRPGAREAAQAEAALKPKLIAEYVEKWRGGRPADGICISELRFERSFTEDGAKAFLKVFDDTTGFTKGVESDKQPDQFTQPDGQKAEESGNKSGDKIKLPWEQNPPPPKPPVKELERRILMEGERELTTGMLAKDASFRLIVSGRIGVKEIERLIKKLEIDKEILAEQDAEPEDEDAGYQQWKQGQ
ncbi:hypothetical protein FJN17_16775 [Bradyrhizobium symbiodeficiens]|uniref:Uncharacterized protein n=1 Tax=Bradyrhizobium symbiodeficiens TaxID=1404367 RepID=A0ABX5W7U6_9BRAD|nr:hypothetical protein [Bradyrhizobium symbiodeficiens]QDF39075.1 hypothetical protein FJN17_16775 [Bradyrhizobium symbiodeficiens]